MPILESSIALIDGHRLYYRGHDAVVLSRSRSVAEVASLIWTERFDTTFAADSEGQPLIEVSVRQRSRHFSPAHNRRWPAASSRDPSAFDLRPAGVARTGWRILQTLTRAAARSAVRAQPIEHTLARAWGVRPHGVDLLRSALILCADHELNVSSFTARCVASAGSNPYAVVIAGLAALGGTRHGGASARVESTLAVDAAGTKRPNGGWRAAASEANRSTGSAILCTGMAIRVRRPCSTCSANDTPPLPSSLLFPTSLDAATTALREKPNIDFALAAVSRVLKLPPGLRTVALRDRPDDWLDRSRHRAIRDGAADSSAREVRRRSCRRRCRSGGVSIGLSSEV